MKNNFKRSLHHKLLFTVNLLLPAIICLIASSIKITPSLRVGILFPSETADFISKDLYSFLGKSQGIRYAKADVAAMNTDLIMGKYQVILDYRSSSKADEFQLLSFEKENKKRIMKEAFANAVRNKAGLDLNNFYSEEGISTAERSVALLTALFMIFSVIQASSIIRDKQSGTFARYRFASRSSAGYVLGGILLNLIVTFVQLLICIFLLQFIQRKLTLGLLGILLLSAVIAVISTILSVGTCLASSSEVQANITVSSLAAIFSLLGGTFIAIEQMPKLLQLLSLASPVRWVIELMRFL
jgi:ABC-type multidrug transport system permease subunit